ncbi:MFS transporter [Actinomadura parmotrematis]|uniref:MFS transporter n=1 Tax=Actinomadura parmotrematis TaxID=2864039 RepID=A0ABS7FPE3_9ACTN|nr:MFS transporter [Actinomadura parmotrematis]MBW8481452.1 MFS transporter [Actinomadura parmotrematis]
MPLAVHLLGFAIFAQGTSEFMLAGLLPGLSADLGVSVPAAGLLISGYAAGMVVGAPALALAPLRWARRTALVAFLAVVAAAHVAGALTSDYGFLMATRLVGAAASAGFFGVAGVAAVGLVPAHLRGRAMAVVIGGVTVATVLGVPAGTLLGQSLGWRTAFWTVAALSLLAIAGVAATLPGGRPEGEAVPRVGDELRAMARPGLRAAYGTAALSFSSTMATFAYLGALLEDTTGLDERWVPAVLALFGAGSLAGIAVGGRIADARPVRTLVIGLSGVVASSAAIALTAGFGYPSVA